MYMENKLIEPGGISVDDIPIDLANVDTPSYFVATVADHIVPWQASFRSSQKFSGPVRFILGGSGHVAGVINPPEPGKYPHWINEESCADAESWQQGATEVTGSWWPDWKKWLEDYSGSTLPARKPGKGKKYPILEDAPGSYVKVRIWRQVRTARRHELIQIKKYPNRRLYDTSQSKYINVEYILELIKKHEDFEIVDSKSGEDHTKSILMQIISEQESDDQQSLLTNSVLKQLIRYYDTDMQPFLRSYLEQSLSGFFDQQETMQQMMKETTSSSPAAMFGKIMEQNMKMWGMASPTPDKESK